MNLLNYEQLPEWYKHNKYINTGYRKITNSFYDCYLSIFSFHNETINIWSHLLGCIEFMLLIIFTLYDDLIIYNKVIIILYCSSISLCYFLSTTYHTLKCHSCEIHSKCILFDYLGIVFKMFGIAISGLYSYYYNYMILFFIYLVIITILLCMVTKQLYNFTLQDNIKYRTMLIGLIIVFSIFPIINASYIADYEQYKIITLSLCYKYIFYLFGGIAYSYHFPEAYIKYNFDFFGNSHNIMHVFVVIGATLYYFGIRDALMYLEIAYN